jgi:hypothetical protein
MQKRSENLEMALRLKAQRKWDNPPKIEEDKINQLDLAAMNDAFDRQEINTNYAESVSTPNEGAVIDRIILKLQNDYISMEERGYRSRHASSIRCFAHSAGRKKGHKSDDGIFVGGVIRYVQDLLQGAS